MLLAGIGNDGVHRPGETGGDGADQPRDDAADAARGGNGVRWRLMAVRREDGDALRVLHREDGDGERDHQLDQRRPRELRRIDIGRGKGEKRAGNGLERALDGDGDGAGGQCRDQGWHGPSHGGYYGE